MFLCYGVFVKILNLWKPSKRNPSQKLLQNTILASVFQPYARSGITDSVSTDLARCKQGLSRDVVDAARHVLKAGKTEETAAYFQKKLIDSGFLKSDEQSATAIVSLLLDIIENDVSISSSAVVDKVSLASKKELLTQHEFILSDFLAGVFLYTVSSVDNRIGKEFALQIDEEFARRSPRREIHVLLRSALPGDADEVSLSPHLEEQIRLCNRTLCDAQNRVRVYGSWDELDFDAVYVPPYLYGILRIRPNISFPSEPEEELVEESLVEPDEPEEHAVEKPVKSVFKRLSIFRHLKDSRDLDYFNKMLKTPFFDETEDFSWLPQMPIEAGNLYIDFQKEERSMSKRQERIGSIFEEDDIIYVVGGAGYGKSLFLKNLCVNPGILKGFNEKPLLIIRGDIKRLIRPDGRFKTMMEFLEECFTHDSLRRPDEIHPDFLDLCLKAGRCLILLDALDEVSNNQRSELHHLIVSYFEDTYPHNKVCITSRERGCIPGRYITCFYIAPITISDIGEYVDRFISLKRFDADEKDRFVKQASVLVNKEFIKGFLTLSLLLAIYKSEQQLPTNKLQLYQKCFEYMAIHREKDKNLIRNSVTGEKYDWTILLRLMSDATFMELAQLGTPNNADIPEDKIKAAILSLYQMKFHSEGECNAATEMFLQFCADRTEVFIPSPNSNLEYRFFHRSFYEYFYAKSISIHTQTVAETYGKLCQFDVDSEVFELLLTIYDQKNPPYLRELVSYAFQQVSARLPAADAQSARAFDVLVMMMQTVDDRDLIEQLILLFLEEGSRIGRLPLSVNPLMIGAVIKKDSPFFQKNLLIKIQSWLIRDFLEREFSYRNLLRNKGQTKDARKKTERFAYSALLLFLPDSDWHVLLDDWFQKFSNTNYLLSVKKLRPYQAKRLSSFAKDLIGIKPKKRWKIYDNMLLKM